jgi:hypothetical protein
MMEAIDRLARKGTLQATAAPGAPFSEGDPVYAHLPPEKCRLVPARR